MGNQTNTGLKRIRNAFVYSWQGIKACFKGEEAFRQEVFLFIIGVPLAIWLGDSPFEMYLMISSLILLMIVELLNSAIEAVVDRFGGDIHELSGQAKDMGSAAVLLAGCIALMTWVVMIFFH